MDIVRILTFAHLRANFTTLKLKQKIFLAIFLLSLFSTLMPQKTFAASIPKIPQIRRVPPLVFDMSDKSYQNYLDSLNSAFTEKYSHAKHRQQIAKRQALINKVEGYLKAQGSPLAEYASELISVKNWKQIVALANAESSLCRVYPKSLANCWGVGGSKMWDFGTTLGDGIIGMNNFLNNYPLRTKLKYSEMSFAQMNGLYKQPAGEHWRYNAQSVYDELTEIEKSI